MRVLLLSSILALALSIALPACGARTDLLFGSDAGSRQPASTATGAGTTETATSPATATYTSASTNTYVLVTNPTGTTTDVTTASCMIAASDFNQSCKSDSDCTLVTTGNYCGSPNCLCATGAINVGVEAAFHAAVAQTPVGSGAVSGGDCPCAAVIGPCCRQSLCTTQCAAVPSDTPPACAMAGGLCEYAPNGPSQCSFATLPTTEPPPPCAYPDEVCCILERL